MNRKKNIEPLKLLILPLALSAVISLFLYLGAFESLELITLDLRLRTQAAERPAPVAFASISQNSLKALGKWPLPRGLYAQAIGNILDDGAMAVLVDIDLSSPGPDPSEDRQLADFISRRGQVVLAVQMEEKTTREGVIIRNMSLPLPDLADAATALGSITFEVDPDGTIRRMPAPIDFIDATFKPLGLIGADLVNFRKGPGVPGDALINFPVENLTHFPNIPFERILRGDFDKDTFRERVVILGSTAPDLHDFWPTPVGVIPGIYIQAAVMETGLNGSWNTRQGLAFAVLTIFLVSLVLSRFMMGAGWKRGTVYLLTYILLVIVFSAVFSRYHLMVQVVPLLVLGLFQYPIQIIMDLRRTEGKLDLQSRKIDTIFKLSELRDAEEAGKNAYQIPMVLLRQLMELKSIYVFFVDENKEGGWYLEKVIGEGPVRKAGEEVILQEVVETGQVLSVQDDPGTVSVYVPMVTSRSTIGILCAVGSPDLTRDEDNARLLFSYATQTAYYIEASDLDRRIKLLYSSTISAITKALDKKDFYTSAHSELSLEYVERFGHACGLDRLEIEALHIGALLHDIGKIGIPDQILSKTGKLTQEEFLMLKGHPGMGYDIIRDLPLPEEVKRIVKHHHERFDGTGYPDGLKGEDIPLLVRIFSVLDTYEALVGKRPYKASCSPEEARKELLDHAGTQFDPDIVKIFLTIIQ